MRRPALALACVSMLAAASVSFAAGINLSWGACGASGQANRAFACNANVGATHVLVGSWMPPAGATLVTGEQIVLDIASASAALPAWWQFKNAGTCRTTALSASADFSEGVAGCEDYWQGQAAGGITAFQQGVGAEANRARVVAVFGVATFLTTVADETREYGAFQMFVSNAQTVGALACAGCLEPVCLVLNSITLTQPTGVGDLVLDVPIARNFVTWQGGVVSGGCPAATPARNATWGALKSLYR